MSWWIAATALQAVGAAVTSSSASKQNKSQLALNEYNANMRYKVSMDNIDSSLTLAGINAELGAMSANMQFGIADLQMETGRRQAELTRQTAALNIDIIDKTTQYNNSLLDQELALMWEAMDLDLTHLANQRAVERGQIEAYQSASGTVMGQDSNADVIIDQRTQEELDTLVVRHQADVNASNIKNQQAQNSWQGAASISQTMWEGEMGAYVTMQNAMIQAQSTAAGGMSQMLQTQANLIGANIQATADKRSAGYEYQSGMYGANTQYSQNKDQIRSNFVSGLFSAGSTAVQGYYQNKVPAQNYGNMFSSGGTAAKSTAANLSAPVTRYKFGSGYQANVSLGSPGSSLIGSGS